MAAKNDPFQMTNDEYEVWEGEQWRLLFRAALTGLCAHWTGGALDRKSDKGLRQEERDMHELAMRASMIADAALAVQKEAQV